MASSYSSLLQTGEQGDNARARAIVAPHHPQVLTPQPVVASYPPGGVGSGQYQLDLLEFQDSQRRLKLHGVSEGNSDDSKTSPCYNKNDPRYIPPEKWGVNRADVAFFEKEVRARWRNGEIPRFEGKPNLLDASRLEDPEDPLTGMRVRVLKTFAGTTEPSCAAGSEIELSEKLVGTVSEVDEESGDIWVDFDNRGCYDYPVQVCYEDLDKLVKDDGHFDEAIGPSIYQVTTHYIEPDIRGGVSWALNRHPEGLECDCFGTHSWCEGAFEFVTLLQRAWPWRSKSIYICFLSNPQPIPLGLLGGKPQESPFYAALTNEKCLDMVVIPNRQVSIYTRLWCVYEANEALALINDNQRKGNFKITMPWVVERWRVLYDVGPAMPLPILGGLIGYFWLAQYIGIIVGPMMWLGGTFTMCWIGNHLLRRVMVAVATRNPHHQHAACLCLIVFAYVELFIVGCAAGMASCHFLNREVIQQSTLARHVIANHIAVLSLEHVGIHLERGERIPCMLFLISAWGLMSWKIFLVLARDTIKDLGARLSHFKTVQDAKCSDANDGRRIRQEICEKITEIDEFVRNLIDIGRFNRGVARNLDLGMGVETVAEGINPFKIITATYAWEFWWVTDSIARQNIPFAMTFSLSTIFGLLALAYYIADEAIYAVDSFLWCGVGFLLMSNHSMFFGQAAASTYTMSGASVWLQFAWLIFMLILDSYHYCGIRKLLRIRAEGTCLEFLWHKVEHPADVQHRSTSRKCIGLE